jgi:hypothetical protein
MTPGKSLRCTAGRGIRGEYRGVITVCLVVVMYATLRRPRGAGHGYIKVDRDDADPPEISDPEGNYLYNLVRKNMRTLDTIEGSDPQNGDKLLFRVNRKMSSTSITHARALSIRVGEDGVRCGWTGWCRAPDRLGC